MIFAVFAITGLVTIACNRHTKSPPSPIISPTGITMVWIPAGTFTMGSPEAEKGRWDGESPQRTVTLIGFYMGMYPVTQEQYETVMGTNPSSFSSNPASGEVQAKRPVETVYWYEALVFANKLSLIEGLTPAYRIDGSTDPADWGEVPTAFFNTIWNTVEIVDGSTGYRLPTEAQWEYACRAGTATAFNNGVNDWEDEATVDPVGWLRFNSGGMTHEVGRKTANAWGLYDMHGNIFEWCWDWFGLYPGEDQADPPGPSRGSRRIMRGGDWVDLGDIARSAYRDYGTPHYRSHYLGFRLVRP